MNNLNIENIVPTKEPPDVVEEVEDVLGIVDDIKHHIDNIHYQNQEIKGNVYFVSSKDLEELPNTIIKLVEEKLENRQ